MAKKFARAQAAEQKAHEKTEKVRQHIEEAAQAVQSQATPEAGHPAPQTPPPLEAGNRESMLPPEPPAPPYHAAAHKTPAVQSQPFVAGSLGAQRVPAELFQNPRRPR